MKNNLEEFILEQCNLTTRIQQEAYKSGYIAGYQAKEIELRAEARKREEKTLFQREAEEEDKLRAKEI